MKLINAHDLVQAILAERETIKLRVPCAPYELLDDKPSAFGQGQRSGIRKALRCINNARAVDAVEVVRCKDCKYLGLKDLCYGYCENRMFGIVNPNDFCSYGERKV